MKEEEFHNRTAGRRVLKGARRSVRLGVGRSSPDAWLVFVPRDMTRFLCSFLQDGRCEDLPVIARKLVAS